MDNISNKFWEDTYRQHIAKMIGVCCRYTQNRQLAEDLAHDAFLVAIHKVSTFESRGAFEAWLRRIVVNVALQHLREQKKQEKWVLAGEQAAFYETLEEENPGSEYLGFSEAELLEVVSYLPEHHRLVFNLHVIDNFTHAQIAAQLNISEGTSKSHLARARKKIRELLHEKLRQDKKQKRALLWFILPFKLWNIDRLVGMKFNKLSIQPRRHLSLDHYDFNNVSIPEYQPFGIVSKVYMKAGVAVIATAALITGVSNWHFNSYKENSDTVVVRMPAPIPDRFPDLVRPIPATISENSIIVEKTKISEPMKNLNTLGGLLMAGLIMDTANRATELPVSFKGRHYTINHNLEPPMALENVKPAVEKFLGSVSGTFYASRLFWSKENRNLYVSGDHVKVDVTKNKFMGSGKFSFLNKINYLVVDGTPAKLGDTIALTDKQYRLVQLDESEGIAKYGDSGKSGVIEIALANP